MDRSKMIENFSKLWFLFLLIFATVVIIKQVEAIMADFYINKLYYKRRTDVQHQYIELIKKKNEFNIVSSQFFIEKQIRDGLGYYKKGEKLVIFTEDVPELEEKPQESKKDTWTEWRNFLMEGISYIDKSYD